MDCRWFIRPWLAMIIACVGSTSLSAQSHSPVRATFGQPTEAGQPLPYSLQELIELSFAKNPALHQAGLQIQAAQGKALQAGLHPNPVFGVSGDELGDIMGPSGIWTTQIAQEIVLGGKLKLNRAVAQREVDQASLGLQSQRFTLLTNVRQGYFEVLAAQRRVEILHEIVKLAQQDLSNAEKLLKGQQIAELDVLSVRLEMDRYIADFETSQRELVVAQRRLAVTIGSPNLPVTAVAGDLDLRMPSYKYEEIHHLIMEVHPDVQAAVAGIDRTEIALRRAQVEKIPNVTVASGYMRQGQNRSNDWFISLSVPVPVFNRNQGNVMTADAEVGRARHEVSRVQNDLAARLASAHGQFSAAKQRADRYRTGILPNATRSYELSAAGFKGGQFDFLRVIQAQRTVAEARLEYTKALGEAWRAASEIAGLTLEEDFPAPPVRVIPPGKK